jgi:hypothetical protein
MPAVSLCGTKERAVKPLDRRPDRLAVHRPQIDVQGQCIQEKTGFVSATWPRDASATPLRGVETTAYRLSKYGPVEL